MSYKKFEDIQYLYESINDQHEEIEECLTLIEDQLRSEGYSDIAIQSFMETADEFALREKVMLLDEGVRSKALELLAKFGPRLNNFGRRIASGVKRNTPVNIRKTVKSTSQKAQDTINQVTTKGKEVIAKGKDKVVSTIKKYPKTSAVLGLGGLTAGAVATSGDGEGQGQGNQSISGNQNRGGGKDDSNNEPPTPAKPGHFKDAQGKEFPSTDTIRGIKRKELSTERTPIINRRGRTTGYTKSEQDIENEKIDKQVDKYVADRKVPINKDLTIDKSEEGKAKYAEKAAERAAKEAEKEVNTPKPVKMSNLEKKNRARFGDAAIDKLKQKQIDFKKMQANSQLPGADRGAEKAKFIKKYPNSITAQKAAGLRDHYDPFDIVLGYLVESEQVDSMDEALYIMMEMDAATIQGIVRDFEILTEEEADRMKDERLEKYGIGHDGSDRKSGSGGRSDSKKPKGKTVLQKETEKKHGKGKSPLEVAKANIISKYGKGSIAPSKKKKK
tara:strand:- start:58 stop:1560 length:1503 start_codon:yes stop_codon:yes gene_type:complete